MNPLNTETPLWAYLAAVALVAFAVQAGSWVKDHYELSGRRPVRRWYGTGAWVTLRADAGQDEPERFKVLAVDADDSDIPWLKAGSAGFAAGEDAEPFWAPVTDFAPEAVRRFRPWICRYGWLRVPVLFAYETFPGDPS
jgi:hypothetical protein